MGMYVHVYLYICVYVRVCVCNHILKKKLYVLFANLVFFGLYNWWWMLEVYMFLGMQNKWSLKTSPLLSSSSP